MQAAHSEQYLNSQTFVDTKLEGLMWQEQVNVTIDITGPSPLQSHEQRFKWD